MRDLATLSRMSEQIYEPQVELEAAAAASGWNLKQSAQKITKNTRSSRYTRDSTAFVTNPSEEVLGIDSVGLAPHLSQTSHRDVRHYA